MTGLMTAAISVHNEHAASAQLFLVKQVFPNGPSTERDHGVVLQRKQHVLVATVHQRLPVGQLQMEGFLPANPTQMSMDEMTARSFHQDCSLPRSRKSGSSMQRTSTVKVRTPTL